MGIRKEQPGAAKAAAKTGLTIGKGKRAEEDRARGEREQARTQQRAAQQEARQAAMEWEATKMRMRSEQDFQQELAAKQWDYEKFNRAKAWDIEKMEIASRNDFQQEEQDRSEKMAKTAAGLKAIDESNNIYPTPEAKEKAKFDFRFKQEHGSYPPRQIQERQERAEFGIKPWWTDPEVADSPEAVAAREKAFRVPEDKPLSATRQVGEIEAQFELEGYTPQDLRELGLDPEDFPGIGEEGGQYTIGQVIPTPQGDMTVVGFDDDGEPLVELVRKKRNEYDGYGATGSF